MNTLVKIQDRLRTVGADLSKGIFPFIEFIKSIYIKSNFLKGSGYKLQNETICEILNTHVNDKGNKVAMT